MTAPVFYDPHQRRWRWFTRLGRAIGIFASLALIAVVGTVLVNPVLPSLGLPPVAPLPQHRLLPPRPERPPKLGERKLEATKVALRNERVAVRVRGSCGAAGAAPDRSLRVLRQLGRHELHLAQAEHRPHRRARARVAPPGDENGNLIENNPPRRQEVLDFVKLRRPDLRVLPLINNFNPDTLDWQSARIGAMLGQSRRRAPKTIAGITAFVERHGFRGVNVDFEAVPKNRQPLLVDFMCELKDAFKPRGWTLSESVPLDDPAFDYKGARAVHGSARADGLRRARGRVRRRSGGLAGVVRRRRRPPRRRRGRGASGRRRRQLRLRLDRGPHRSRQPVVVPGGDARGATNRRATPSSTPTASIRRSTTRTSTARCITSGSSTASPRSTRSGT